MAFYEQAEEKLRTGFDRITGQKETAMKTAVRDALLRFAAQEDEFAQAIAQGGSFFDCMKEVARGVGTSISDLEAYEKAVRFYFPGSRVRFEMHVDLVGDASSDGEQISPRGPDGLGRNDRGEKGGLVLDLSDFL
jgi:hypothetical protein